MKITKTKKIIMGLFAVIALSIGTSVITQRSRVDDKTTQKQAKKAIDNVRDAGSSFDHDNYDKSLRKLDDAKKYSLAASDNKNEFLQAVSALEEITKAGRAIHNENFDEAKEHVKKSREFLKNYHGAKAKEISQSLDELEAEIKIGMKAAAMDQEYTTAKNKADLLFNGAIKAFDDEKYDLSDQKLDEISRTFTNADHNDKILINTLRILSGLCRQVIQKIDERDYEMAEHFLLQARQTLKELKIVSSGFSQRDREIIDKKLNSFAAEIETGKNK